MFLSLKREKNKIGSGLNLLDNHYIEAVGLFRSLMQIRSQHLSTIYEHNLS